MKLASTPTLLLVLNLSASVAAAQYLRVRQLSLTNADGSVWDCPEDTLVAIGTWNDYFWSELPPCVQDAGAVFGYDEKKWNAGEDLCPDFCDESWEDLTDEQKSASWVLGYDEEMWSLPPPITYSTTTSNSTTTATTTSASGAVWDCPEDTLVVIGTWDDFSWSVLPPCVQDAAVMFGYDEEKWKAGEDLCPDFCDELWEELTAEQQSAALVLGYDEEKWTLPPPITYSTTTSNSTIIATTNSTSDAVWDCPEDALVVVGTWDGYFWSVLPPCVQVAAVMFGYDEEKWKAGEDLCPDFCNESWEDLTAEQKSAVLVLGYDEEKWTQLPPTSAASSQMSLTNTTDTANSTVSPTPTTNSTTASNSTTTATTNSTSGAVWDCPEDTLVVIGTWDDFSWSELPPCVQVAATVFGYDEEKWKAEEDLCPDFCDESWEDLTDEQKSASWVLGYDEEMWSLPPPITYSTSNSTTTATTNSTSGAVWDCPEDTLVVIGTWDGFSWSVLPPCVQDAAVMFGYDEEKWKAGEDLCPDFCDELWEDLTDEQKSAAWVLGYDDEKWTQPPTTSTPTTVAPTTVAPTTVTPTTVTPTIAAPTTSAPTTAAPTKTLTSGSCSSFQWQYFQATLAFAYVALLVCF